MNIFIDSLCELEMLHMAYWLKNADVVSKGYTTSFAEG